MKKGNKLRPKDSYGEKTFSNGRSNHQIEKRKALKALSEFCQADEF